MVLSAIVIKVLLYGCALLSIGLALQSVFRIYDTRRLLIYMGVLTLVFAGLRLLQLNANAGGGWSFAFEPDTFSWIWAANKSQSYAFLIGIFLIIFAAFGKLPGAAKGVILGLGALALAAGFGLSGHTQGLEEPGFMPVLVAGHVLIAGFWIAAPMTLYPKGGLNPLKLKNRVSRFSQIAVWIVPLLFVSGLWLLWTISGSIQNVVSENYGRLLLLKLVLASALLTLGAFNKLYITRELQTHPVRAQAKLKKTLKLEAILFMAILISIATVTTVIGPGHG